MEKRLYGYKIFCGVIAGVVVDTSWENARNKVRDYYRNNEKYLKYRDREKELFRRFEESTMYDEPMIEIYDLTDNFERYIDDVYELTI